MNESKNNLICVITEENYDIAKKKGLWGVKSRYKKLLDRTNIGDKLIFYVIGTKLGGIFEVVSKPYYRSGSLFKGGTFNHLVKIKPVFILSQLITFDNKIRKQLDFIKNKKGWPAYFRRAMLSISDKDFKVLESSLK